MDIASIPVSTKTIIGTSNLTIDIQKVYMDFPLEEDGPLGPIQVRTIYYGNDKRGDLSFEKKKTKKSFRNAVNVVVGLDNNTKRINFKLSKNGKFQLTGCKSEEHAKRVVCYFIEKLVQNCREHIHVDNGLPVKVFFQTVMTNIDFSIGFFINRRKLDELMNRETSFHSLLETSCGYTGVNIKFPLEMKWWELNVPCLTSPVLQSIPGGMEEWCWKETQQPLHEICELPMDKMQKKKYNTFLVFHSGNIIMSGMTKETMKKDFDQFISLLKVWRPTIEEKIVEA